MPDTILYGFVSDQAAANLIPVMQLKPQTVVLLHSNRMTEKAKILHKLLRERSMKVELSLLENDTDFEGIKNKILGHLADAAQGTSHVFNVTGGTKLMAMALMDVAHADDPERCSILYLDLDSQKLVRIDRANAAIDLEVKITLNDYLRAYGIAIENTVQQHPDWNPAELKAFQTITSRIVQFQPAISRLNGLAAAAETRGLRAELEHPNPLLNELIDLFAGLGKLTICGSSLQFNDKSTLNYVKGGWLEHLVFQAISELQHELEITDKFNSVEFVRQNDPSVRNEVDTLFMRRNRVHVIECKTSRMQGGLAQEKANDQLHKLANLSITVGGLGARSAFVSLQTLNDFEKRLARQMGITIIHGSDLGDLKGALKRWIKP